LQLEIFSALTAGVQANVNPWGATWALEDVEALAAFIPTQTTRELLVRWEWSETNAPPVNMPSPPFLQITWDGNTSNYRGLLINGEPLLIFQKEEEYLALNIVDQVWLTSFILACDEPPLRAKLRRWEKPTNPPWRGETTPQPPTCGGEGAQEDV
jgi:hypothetical protein